MAKIIPEGWFFAIENESHSATGTAMCLHNYTGKTPFAGDVGWLACDSRHRGHGLGYSLTAYATNRFLSAGYTKIQLHTESWRLPAIKTYLKLGYLPVVCDQAVYYLWEKVCRQINWEFSPDTWPGEI
jgi:mycothiol synthase